MLSSGLAEKSHSAHSSFVQDNASPVGTGETCWRGRAASAERLDDPWQLENQLWGAYKGLWPRPLAGVIQTAVTGAAGNLPHILQLNRVASAAIRRGSGS